MERLARACARIDRISEAIGHVLAWLLLALIVVVFGVVIARYGFSWGRIWLQESYLWLHALVLMLGAGYTLRHDGHVRIDLIYGGAGQRYRALVDLLGGLLLLLPVLLLILAESLPYVATSWRQLERSREAGGLPALYLLKAVIPLFAATLLLQGLALIGRSWLRLAGRGDLLAAPR